LDTWPSVERTLLVTLAVAIEKAWFAVKGHSFSVLCVVKGWDRAFSRPSRK
jgi:hypothetical protein